MEPRIKAAVAHNGVVSFREHIRKGEWFEAEFIVPRLMQVADVHHILSLVAPRPFLLSTTDGAQPTSDATEVYQKILPIYEKQGAPNRMSLYRYKATSGFEVAMRVNAYNWLDSWLKPF